MSRRASVKAVVGVGFLVALLLAFLVSPQASSSPDGLRKIAADKGIDSEVRDHATAGGPLAGYAVNGIDDNGLSTGIAAIIGVTITFAFAFGISKLTKASRSGDLAEKSVT